MARILVIEDDALTADAVGRALVTNCHDVVYAANGLDGLRLAASGAFDVVTLDRMLPGLDGLSVVTRLRAAGVVTPILMISALSDVDERIAGLRAGGDDYLTKPFAAAEMTMRVEVLLRRAETTGGGVLQAGSITLDRIKRQVAVDGQPVRLLATEFRLLEFLMRNAGRTVSRRLIFERVWDSYFDPGTNLIDVHIARLRRKLDMPDRPSAIITIKGEGYRLDADH